MEELFREPAWLKPFNETNSRINQISELKVVFPITDKGAQTVIYKIYELGVLDKDEALKRLEVEKLYDQMMFHTEKALRLCNFKEFIVLEGE